MPPFSLFGGEHLLTLLSIALLLVGLVYVYRKASPNIQRKLSITLALCCLLSHPLQWGLTAMTNYSLSLESKIPFHLCDLAAIICGLALLTRSTRLCEIAYFWGLTGTLQGLITPEVAEGFPSPLYIIFFWNHGFVVITALFIPLALKWKPEKNAIWRVFGITQLYAISAMLINHLLGTNYGFLHNKPTTASLLDFFPDWPWYILVLEFLCLSLFFLLYLPLSKKSVK